MPRQVFEFCAVTLGCNPSKKTGQKFLVPRVGFEPTRPLGQRILSPPCLPFHHLGPNIYDSLEPCPYCRELNGNCDRSESYKFTILMLFSFLPDFRLLDLSEFIR